MFYTTGLSGERMREGYAQLKDAVLQIIYESDVPVDVKTIADKLNVHWFTAYRTIAEIVLEDVIANPELLDKLRIRPIKTTRGWLFTRPGRGSRPDDEASLRARGGRIIIADYVLGQESSSQPSSQGQEGAEGLTAKRQSQEPRLMCDGGEPERPSLWISAVIRTVDIEHELREALLLVRLLQEAREKQHVLQEALESLREHLEKATHIVQSLRNMIVQARIEGLEPALACDGGEPEELVIYDYSEHSRAWIEVDRDTRAIHIVQVLPYNPPEKVAVTFLDKELPKLMTALEEARQRLVGPVRPGGGEPQGLAERGNPSGIGPRGGPGAESSEGWERP